VDDDDTTPASSWTRRRSSVTLLALVVGISPFATDMYVPALPAIARDLGTVTDATRRTAAMAESVQGSAASVEDVAAGLEAEIGRFLSAVAA
jgi:hypothetical protein